MAWLSAEKIDALSGRRHLRVCVQDTHAAATFGPSLDPSVYICLKSGMRFHFLIFVYKYECISVVFLICSE